jgi:hypothetical protein
MAAVEAEVVRLREAVKALVDDIEAVLERQGNAAKCLAVGDIQGAAAALTAFVPSVSAEDELAG